MSKIKQPLPLDASEDQLRVEKRRLLVAATLRVLGKGYSKTPTNNSWRAMLKRCYQPKCNGYHNYGGRGITVCSQWRESYLAFFNDLGERPQGMVLDRIDVNGHYVPGNCQWASRVDSIRNKRSAPVEFIDGESTADRNQRTAKAWEIKNREKRSMQERQRRLKNPEHHKKRCLDYYYRTKELKRKAALSL